MFDSNTFNTYGDLSFFFSVRKMCDVQTDVPFHMLCFSEVYFMVPPVVLQADKQTNEMVTTPKILVNI